MAKNEGLPDGIKVPLMWTLGIGIIALTLLILVILFGNLSGNVGFGSDTSSHINETTTITDTGGTPASAVGSVNGALTNVVLKNSTSDLIAPGNYSVSGIVITNLTGDAGGSMNVSYTLSQDSQGKIDTQGIILNYTASATNTSAQFPTIGTIIGVAILLVILIGVLIFAITKMMGVVNVGGSQPNQASFA